MTLTRWARPRRGLALALAVVAGCAPALVGSQAADAQTSTISVLPSLTNYIYTMRQTVLANPDPGGTTSTSVLADPTNHLLFEVGADGSPKLCAGSHLVEPRAMVSVDSDTYARRAVGCAGNRPGGAVGGSSTDVPLAAIDSRDKVLFFSDAASDTASATAVDSIVVVSETTLKPVRTLALPSDAVTTGRTIFGLSFDPRSGQLLVQRAGSQSANSPAHVAPTPILSVTAYDVRALLKGVATPVWDTRVSHCVTALDNQFGTSYAFRSQRLPFIYVPCGLTGTLSANTPRTGIVRLSLDRSGAPDGQELATAAPGSTADAMFDPGSDRVFMPTQTNTGTSLLTYDGRTGLFAGRAAVVDEVAGKDNPDNNCVMFGLDPVSGRLVGTGPTGMTLIDGRRTPLAPGTTLPDLGGEVQYNTMPILPPDARHPFRRIIVNYLPKKGGCAGAPGEFIDRFSVFADRLPVTSDPSATSVDANTISGPIPTGADISTSYGANASGAGARTMAVGSYGGVVNNTNGGEFVNGNQLPLGAGTRNLLAGFVQQTHGTDGSAVVDSTALGDGNSTTASGVTQCTSIQGLGGCAHLPVPASGPATGQQWPFPVAQCTRPGDAKSQSSHQDGFYATSGYGADGKPTVQQVPGSAALAQATADCNDAEPAAGTASAIALLRSLSLPDATGTTADIHVGSSQTSTVVTPVVNGVVRATTVAATRGVDVSIAGFELTIDSVRQTAQAWAGGRRGTAGAFRDVVLGGVSVTSPAGQKTVICDSACKGGLQQVIDQINASLPAAVEILQPQPAQPYGGTAMDASGHQKLNGSPGGYLAVVQASADMQYGDAQFNSVPANDGETTLLPALRIVTLYDAGPVASTQLDRQIVDLAPVEVDAELGISLLPAVVTNPPAPPLDAQKVVAGVTPLPRTYVPGTPTTNGTSPQIAGGLGGGANVYDRALAGLGWIVRSPGEVLRIFVTLCLLGLPVLLATRRHQWLRLPPGGSS